MAKCEYQEGCPLEALLDEKSEAVFTALQLSESAKASPIVKRVVDFLWQRSEEMELEKTGIEPCSICPYTDLI